MKNQIRHAVITLLLFAALLLPTWSNGVMPLAAANALPSIEKVTKIEVTPCDPQELRCEENVSWNS